MSIKSSIIVLLLAFPCLSLFARDTEQEETYRIRQKSLSIDLEVDGGKIIVMQSHNKYDCNVLLSYPREKCHVDVKYNKQRGQLDISMDNEKWNFDSDDENTPRLVLELPYGPEISLSAYIKAGTTSFDIGDLKIVDFELRNWAGECSLTFTEPNRTTMRSFDVNVKIGEVELLNLGNALFEDADINSGIGELTVDFHGKNLAKSVAHIDLDIGETTIILPENIGAKLKVSRFLFLSDIKYPHWFEQRGNYYYSENYNDNNKKLSLMISSGIGDLKVKVE